jgi:exodeoxyribonuclease VII large subunit
MESQLELGLRAARQTALSVTQLVRIVRDTLDIHLDEYWVVGEISNSRLAPSNHLYFTLKDARSAINVVMFNSAYRRLRFRVSDGMEVVVRGRVNVYESRGTLQLYAEEMEPRGLGALQLAFEQLKQRLAAEGLFDAARKRPLPFLPRTVGIVTALGGAGLRDMLRILLERFSNLEVIIAPARVQGTGAAGEIVQAIEQLNRHGRAEVIIVGRGGGSLEDLWAFNDEAVARAIHQSAVPVISAVGHEIDYTIADFVADVRAPTPTAAAQLVVPGKDELKRRLEETGATLRGAMQSALTGHRRQLGHLAARLKEPALMLRQARQRLDEAGDELHGAIRARLADSRRSVREFSAHFRRPEALARERRLVAGRLAVHLAQTMGARAQRLRIRVERLSALLGRGNARAILLARRARMDAASGRLNNGIAVALAVRRRQLAEAAARLDSLSPLRVLERGYAVVTNRRDGRVVVDAAAVEIGDELDLRVNRGRLRARTTAREP